MSIPLHDHSTSGVVVRLPPGLPDTAALSRMVSELDHVAAGHAPVVVDLTDVIFASRRVVQAISDCLEELAARADVRVVCRRLSARRLLHRFGNEELEIFPSVESALVAI